MYENWNDEVDIHLSKYLYMLHTYFGIITLKILSTSLVFCFTALHTLTLQAVAITDVSETDGVHRFYLSETFNDHNILSDAQFFAENKQESDFGVQSGELIIPGVAGNKGEEEQCVTVCDEWGKDCIINPKTGVRKCRRMCKSFGRECI